LVFEVSPVTEPNGLVRRRLLGAMSLSWLVSACSTPLPMGAAPPGDIDDSAAARLRDSAIAHGLEAYRGISDISVSYAGEWRPLVGRIQPEIVDPGFRGSSEERLLPRTGLVAQEYTGPRGRKHVAWQRGRPEDAGSGEGGSIAIWFNGTRSDDRQALDAAALVAEGYGLFLLGPLWLVDRGLPLRSAGVERVDGRICDVVDVWMRPGLGRTASDRVALCISRGDGLVRRIRFTLEGFSGTRGAVAEVDTFEHERLFGVTWPMRSYERVVHPLPLPAHDWHVVGLDVNRGYGREDIAGPSFAGAAAAPAKAVR
jgi:hypothetical protein